MNFMLRVPWVSILPKLGTLDKFLNLLNMFVSVIKFTSPRVLQRINCETYMK